MSQLASTPPPCPPNAAMVNLIGRSVLVARSVISTGQPKLTHVRHDLECVTQPLALTSPLKRADDGGAHLAQQAIPARRVVHKLRAIERRTEHGRVGHFPTHSAAHAAVVDISNRI